MFDALFKGYAFTQHNPVSLAMQKMLDSLKDEAIEKEAATLEKFYSSVRTCVEGLETAEARQHVVKELYDKFFNIAFPRMAKRLGIVYTPIEVVDFIVRSVEDILREEFDSSLGAENVHIIDPFTGTGTFIVRLLQSGLIPAKDLLRKYQHELHANEIVLLAYYIAAINIEETFHGLRATEGTEEYIPFDGIVLTDTFQLYEPEGKALDNAFPENNARVRRQKQSPIRVVIANPPYSALQTSENDKNKNLKYPALDQRIRQTYAARSSATLLNSVYDSYVRAIRWASDRIENRGVIGFVTNGSYIEANSLDGVRACLADEFTSIWVFNLRGNQRTSGERSRQEGGKIFGSGSRAPIAITMLVKNPAKLGQREIRYHDIGDSLSREDKLAIVKHFASVGGLSSARGWTSIQPNAQQDWTDQRDPSFGEFIQTGAKQGSSATVFEDYSSGVKTNRDAWCFNFSEAALAKAMRGLIDFYNAQVEQFVDHSKAVAPGELGAYMESFVETDPKKISWTRELKADLLKAKSAKFRRSALRVALYRPFVKQRLYFDRQFNNCVYQIPQVFPEPGIANLLICATGPGATKEFSCVMTDVSPDLEVISKSVCFPLHLYEQRESAAQLISHTGAEMVDGYRRRSAITDAIQRMFRDAFGPTVTNDDIFYYVYGVLHSPEYRTRFASDLKKMLPRIPLTRETADFCKFSKAGRDLAEWHLNYETIEPFPLKEHCEVLDLDPESLHRVEKMTFGRPSAEQKASGEKWDKTRIIYNGHITLSGIPAEAYEYVVNGKPAIEWIMERYQVTVDKDSGIRNDPNDWSKEHGQPRYIIDLVKRIVRVSLETMKVVNSLPALNER